ncbi:hypothetical protein Tco_1273285 [Tanacetum coccineum]
MVDGNDEIEGKAIGWNETCNKLCRKYYSLSHSSNSKVPDDLDNGTDYLEFFYWLALKFANYWEIDKNTQNGLWEFYVMGTKGAMGGPRPMNPRNEKLTKESDLSEICCMEHGPYAVSRSHHRFMFPETVPFPRRLHNYCCDDLKEKWHNGTSSRTRSTKTSDGLAAIQAQLNNLGREIKKVNKKVYASQVRYKQCKGPHYTKDCPQKEGKTLEEAYYIQFGAPYQPGGQYRAAGPGFYQPIRNQGASIKTLELQIGQMNKVLKERGFGSLPSSTKTNPRDQVKSISIATADLFEIRRMEHGPYAVSGSQHRFMFPERVPFPRRLHNYCCDEEAHRANILDAYDDILPQK